MPTQRQIIAKNKRNKRIRKGVKGVVKGIIGVIVTILSIITALLLAMYILHSVQTNSEIEKLQEAELYNQVEVEKGRDMNVALWGNAASGHVMVPISDIGVQDFTVFAQHIATNMKDDMAVAFVDRAGYGFSDDSSDAQTVEQIVDDYRAALSAANIKGPYLLMAHKFGGVYATYWSLKYPDEIEGIVYLDGTEILEDSTTESVKATNQDAFESLAYKLGFQRIKYYEYYNHYPKALTKLEAECSKALNVHSVKTKAYLSEVSLKEKNLEKVKGMLESTDIPKMYISTVNGFTTEKDVIKYYEYKNEQNTELGEPPFYYFSENVEKVSEDAQMLIEASMIEYNRTTLPFAELLGNCHVARMPGDAKIYEQKPEGVTEALSDFLLYLDGKLWELKDHYDDMKAINWENYVEEHGITMTDPTEAPTEPEKPIG